MDQLEKGFILGFFTGQGSFGGDGRTPHLTVRMNIKHEGLLHKLCQILPGSNVYGPYAHSDRQYYQWMLRGEELANYVELFEELKDWDSASYERFKEMKDRYFVSDKLRFRSKKRRRITSSKGGSSTDSV